MTGADCYRGGRISLLTQHGKQQVVGPLFTDALAAQLELATGFDTDCFGTFTRDVARQGNQLEAARKKAAKGMELLGGDCGVGSEGSLVEVHRATKDLSRTDETRAVRWGRVRGDHFENHDVATSRFADPYRCPTCNP